MLNNAEGVKNYFYVISGQSFLFDHSVINLPFEAPTQFYQS